MLCIYKTNVIKATFNWSMKNTFLNNFERVE